MVLIALLKTNGLSYGKVFDLVSTLLSLKVTESTVNHAVSVIAKAFGKKY